MSSKDIVNDILFNRGPEGSDDLEESIKRRRLGTIADRTDTVMSGDNPFGGPMSNSDLGGRDGTLT